MQHSPTNPTRYDAPDFLEVYEIEGDFADRWVVYIGNDCYTMSDNANMPNGVNMYAGSTADLFRGMIEGRPTILCDLPEGTRLAIVEQLVSEGRPVPSGLIVAPFTGPLAERLLAEPPVDKAVSEAISQGIFGPENPTPGCPSPLLAALLDPCMMPALEAYAASKNANAVRCLENARAAVANALDPSPLPARVIVIMAGGLIQNVLIADGEPAHVVVIDYDTEGAGDDETIPVPQAEPGETEPAIISHWSNPPKVNAEEPNGAFLLSLFGYRSPRNETRPA
jgi:hypothetical protein